MSALLSVIQCWTAKSAGGNLLPVAPLVKCGRAVGCRLADPAAAPRRINPYR